ncbi:MAG: hypothetical protein U0793_33495 [Gemmataceae bacterium]
MSFKVRVSDSLRRRMIAWSLPDPILVDVYLRLQELRDEPAQKLMRLREPFDGMHYIFSMIDPQDRLTEYRFLFLVRYGQDEESLIVVRGGLRKATGY